MEKGNNLGRLLAVVLLTMLICFALYGLPDELFGYPIKKVDLLSDIRIKPKAVTLDSLKVRLAEEEVVTIDSASIRQAAMQTHGIDSAAITSRQTLYQSRLAEQSTEDSCIRIEDFSPGYIGLKRFFTALNNRDKLDRPVRVAFLGDSFIEGDIMVADFRSLLQKRFGGRGVGFVPITSVTAQFRPTIDNTASGWTTLSMLTDQSNNYIFSGMTFEAGEEQAIVTVKNTKRYPELPTVSSVRLLYEQNQSTEMQLVINNGADTLKRTLPPTNVISENVWRGEITEATYTFNRTEGFKALGIALEDESGIIVDNFSLRGNSGMIFDRLTVDRSKELSAVRPYDLIVLQYGLNVVSEDVMDYSWYTHRMVKVIEHLRECFPDTDILLLSVTDRSHQVDGEFETMPEVLAMVHAQRQIARRAAIPFWNMFEAMGGENSMVRYVANNWASKDYTHFSFRGGREVAEALIKALMLEKEFYDEAEKDIH